MTNFNLLRILFPMKRYIYFSFEAGKYYNFLKTDLEKQAAHSVFRINFIVLKKGLIPPQSKIRNALFVISSIDLKDPFFKNLTHSVILRHSATVERERKKLYLPFPKKANASFVSMTISVFAEKMFHTRLYEDSLGMLEAFEKSAELSRSELMNMRQIIEAQENNLEYSRQEQIHKDKIINAQEQVRALSRAELLSYDKVLQAWEIFSEMIRKELIESQKESVAISSVLDLAAEERKEKDRIIEALDNTIEMSRQERQDTEKISEASENTVEFRRRLDLDEVRYIDAISEENLGKLLGNEKLWIGLVPQDKRDLVLLIKALFRSMLHRRHHPSLN